MYVYIYIYLGNIFWVSEIGHDLIPAVGVNNQRAKLAEVFRVHGQLYVHSSDGH